MASAALRLSGQESQCEQCDAVFVQNLHMFDDSAKSRDSGGIVSSEDVGDD